MVEVLTDNELTQLRDIHDATLRDTCVITPSVRPGETATPETVVCAVLSNPTAGSGSGGFSGRHGGGGNQIARRFERSVVLPYGTVVQPAATIEWVEGGETITVADVERAGTYGTSVKAHGARTGT